jgi:protein-disulfide isomerase
MLLNCFNINAQGDRMFLRFMFFFTAFVIAGCQEANTKATFHFKDQTGSVAAKTEGIEITRAELMKGIESDIYEQEKKIFDIKFNRLKTLLLEKYVAKDPKAKGLKVEEFLEKSFAKQIAVTQKEVQDFIKEKQIPANHVNDNLKTRIETYLKSEKLKGVVDTFLGSKTGKKGIEVFFKKPSPPTFEVKVGAAPTVGGKNAPVTIVEFSDFQCPFCSKALPILKELKKKYGDKIKVAFKHYPLPFHKQAEKAAVASMCAHEQGEKKFWEYHDHLFENQSKLEVADLKAAAKKLGLKTQEFDECLDGNKYLAYVRENVKEAQELGVKSTPTFFVNGKLVNGAQPVAVFSELIDAELK